ncbi:hypothetical protein EIP91_010043 [Steccherinum ochraceum]|uniref:Uncharacterized protein n=1 Tax=Steccherinum ochraceum TaxID=92696 RepID=A0A4V2MUZ6_9APHY|nr:hypothetical protein EIP91_010043 [Steccherinum ochraceum]
MYARNILLALFAVAGATSVMAQDYDGNIVARDAQGYPLEVVARDNLITRDELRELIARELNSALEARQSIQSSSTTDTDGKTTTHKTTTDANGNVTTQDSAAVSLSALKTLPVLAASLTFLTGAVVFL